VVVCLKDKENVPASFTEASNWSDIQAVYGVPAAQAGGLEFAIEPALGFVKDGYANPRKSKNTPYRSFPARRPPAASNTAQRACLANRIPPA
jgi:hypothetical protein